MTFWLVAALVIICIAQWAVRLRGKDEMLYVEAPIAIGAWSAGVNRLTRQA